jgi:Flp pilus assembly pilin Flp
MRRTGDMMSVLHLFRSVLHRFAEDTRGVSAIEYALLLGGIAVVIIATVGSVGEKVFSFFSQIDGGIGG